jgi:hypothetical protein
MIWTKGLVEVVEKTINPLKLEAVIAPFAERKASPEKDKTFFPAIVDVPVVGCKAAVPCVTLMPLPDLSFHCETAPPDSVIVEVSEASNHAKGERDNGVKLTHDEACVDT